MTKNNQYFRSGEEKYKEDLTNSLEPPKRFNIHFEEEPSIPYINGVEQYTYQS